jgi:hypothetical protein
MEKFGLINILLSSCIIYFSLQIGIADDLNLNLKIKPINKMEVLVGEPFLAEILIYPRKLISLEEVKQLENSLIPGTFYLGRIEKLKVSENNNEVLEVYADIVILMSNFKEAYSSINLGPTSDKKFLLNLSELKIINDQKNLVIEKPILLLRPWRPKNWPKIIAISLVSLVVLAFFAWLVRKKLMVMKNIKNEKVLMSEQKKLWLQKFSNAQTRKEFEEIYLCRNEWTKLQMGNENKIGNFIKMIDDKQYQPQWNGETISKLKSEIENLKGAFNHDV